MIAEDAVVVTLPSEVRETGAYVGYPLFVPAEATYVTAIVGNRGGWLQFGVGEAVVELVIEVNIEGKWEVLGGCTTDASEKRGKSGEVQDSTTLRCRLPRQRIPVPQVRAVLRCASQCEGAVTLVFDDVPLPEHPAQEHHSVTYDSDNEAVGANVASVTIGSFAVAGNANRCMLVGCASYDPTAGDSLISTITHNGSTTGWSSVITRIDGGNSRSSIWSKVAPSAVSSTVVVTCVGASVNEIGANAISLYDVDQTTPIAGAVSAEGAASPATINVSSATNDMVYDAVYSYGSLTHVGVVGASQAQRANSVVTTYGGARTLFLASTEPGATTVTMSWTITDSDEWVHTACAIKPAPAGAPAYAPKPFMLSQAVQRAALY